MKLDLTPFYASSVGFDRFGSLLDAALSNERQSAGGYPPYDIERVEENEYNISIAVAGFRENEIDVQVENGVLTVRGKKESAVREIPEAMKPRKIPVGGRQATIEQAAA